MTRGAGPEQPGTVDGPQEVECTVPESAPNNQPVAGHEVEAPVLSEGRSVEVLVAQMEDPGGGLGSSADHRQRAWQELGLPDRRFVRAEHLEKTSSFSVPDPNG